MKQVSLQDWLDDNQGAQIRHTQLSLYLDALHRGVTDRRVIANCIALAEASAILARKYPHVPFDDIAELVLSQQTNKRFMSLYSVLQWRWLIWLSLHHRYHSLRWHLLRPWRCLRRQWAAPAETTYRIKPKEQLPPIKPDYIVTGPTPLGQRNVTQAGKDT